MRATIRDKQALGAVGLPELSSYLRAAGWVETGFERFVAWRREREGEIAEIILPKDPTAGDLVPRIADALARLEEVEERSQLEILLDVTYATSDVVRITRPVPSDADGSIPIDEGIALVENARQMFFAAASSAVAPRRVFPSRR